MNDKTERRRMQNRRNQRARRTRTKDAEFANGTNQKRPYRVHRWRPTNGLDEQFIDSDTPLDMLDVRASSAAYQPPTEQDQPTQHQHFFTLPADHLLLPLIHVNVGRGLSTNKALLRTNGAFVSASVRFVITHPHLLSPCEMVVTRPAPPSSLTLTTTTTTTTTPPSLAPPQLQMNVPHPSWIDALPFPRLRDALIRAQHDFDHMRFLEDLIGDLAHTMPLAVAREGGLTDELMLDENKGRKGLPVCAAPDLTPEGGGVWTGNGLILWGEPHLAESWEVTPGFLRRWEWATWGMVEELVGVANRWRAVRGEDAIEVEMSLAGEHIR